MTESLTECVVALSGRFKIDGVARTHADLANQIKDKGGKHVAKVTDEVTHLVATAVDVENDAPKVKQAKQLPAVKIVDENWLRAAILGVQAANGSQSSASQPSSAAPPSAPASAATKGKKRAHDEVQSYRDPSADVDALEDEEEEQPPLKKPKDGQKAKSTSLCIPVDETCPLAGTHRVYISEDGTIYDAALNQTSAGDNHNKFYRIQLLVSVSNDYKTWTRWGRVGAAGAFAMFGDGSLGNALNVFNKKFKEKAGNAWEDRLEPTRTDRKKAFYTFIERRYENDPSDDDDEDVAGSSTQAMKHKEPTSPVKRAQSQLPKPVQRLMELIFNQQFFENTMTVMEYDADKLPLGQLSKHTLQRGYQALKDLSGLLDSPGTDGMWDQRVQQLSNMFYTLIPHNFGFRRPPVIYSDEMLRKEIALLESLSDMEIANKIMKDTGDKEGNTFHALDRRFAALGLQEMTPLAATTDEFTLVQDYLLKTHGATHSLKFKVQDIFRVERTGEADRFDNVTGGDRRLLWHGSRCTNFGGILSQGLRIAPPEAPVTGYAFGKGVYLADMSSKSANYCYASTSGGTGLLLLCEALLQKPGGKPMLELDVGFQGDPAAQAKQVGAIATWGKGMTGPVAWKDASGLRSDLAGVKMPDTTKPPGPTGIGKYLQYHEYIAYDISQVKLRYLLRVEIDERF